MVGGVGDSNFYGKKSPLIRGAGNGANQIEERSYGLSAAANLEIGWEAGNIRSKSVVTIEIDGSNSGGV